MSTTALLGASEFNKKKYIFVRHDEPFLCPQKFCRVYRQSWKVISGVNRNASVPGMSRVTLSADTVNFWSCMWSCGWPWGAVASSGSALGLLLQRKHRHVTPIMTYIKDSLSLCKSQRQRKKPGWNVTSLPSIDVWRWHHSHMQARLPREKRCGSLIAVPGFGCSAFSHRSHIHRGSVDKKSKYKSL